MTETASTETKSTEAREFEGTIESAHGSELPAPLSFSGTYEHVLNYDAIPAKEMPDKDDVLTLVNNKRKANARQKLMQSTLDDAAKAWTGEGRNPYVKPTLEDSEELQLKTMVAGMVASKKYNVEDATKLARKILGLSE